MPAFTAPTLTQTQEGDLETYKQVFELLDDRLADIERSRKAGHYTNVEARNLSNTCRKTMEKMSDAANSITGCPLGVWLD